MPRDRLRFAALSSADSADFPPAPLTPDPRGRYFELEILADGSKRLTAAVKELGERYDLRRLESARGRLKVGRRVMLPVRDAFAVRGPDDTIRVVAQVNASTYRWMAHSVPVPCSISAPQRSPSSSTWWTARRRNASKGSIPTGAGDRPGPLREPRAIPDP